MGPLIRRVLELTSRVDGGEFRSGTLGFVRITLVHSPLVGPTTWQPVATFLTALGHDVSLPDLREATQSGDPYAFIAAARSAVSADTDLIAGHSGAGFFLPMIAASAMSAARLVFVDAGIPPDGGPATAGGDFIDHLRGMSTGGSLPRWSTWWGAGVMEHLVPDTRLRSEIEAEVVEVPIGFYERDVDIPIDWRETPAGYLLLSESYRHDATNAHALGWPTRERIGGHLDIANFPEETARTILALQDAAAWRDFS